MGESESNKTRITGQVLKESRPDGRHWWIDEHTRSDGEKVYERKIVGGVHGQSGPFTDFDPDRVDPQSESQIKAGEEFTRLKEKRSSSSSE